MRIRGDELRALRHPMMNGAMQASNLEPVSGLANNVKGDPLSCPGRGLFLGTASLERPLMRRAGSHCRESARPRSRSSFSRAPGASRSIGVFVGRFAYGTSLDKSLAGKLPVKDIAAELGRSFGATTLEAHKLGLSLRRFRSAQPRHVSASSDPWHPSNH
jgi:hypothetical protein